LQFLVAIIQYFTCSTLSIRPKDDQPIDMAALFEQRRPILLSSFAGLCVVALVLNYWDRNVSFGQRPTDWISANISILFALASIALAAWAKPRWMQWVGGLGLFAVGVQFLVAYTVTN